MESVVTTSVLETPLGWFPSIGTGQSLISNQHSTIVDPKFFGIAESGPAAPPKRDIQIRGTIYPDTSSKENSTGSTEFLVVVESSNTESREDNTNQIVPAEGENTEFDEMNHHHSTIMHENRPEVCHENGTPKTHLVRLSNKLSKILYRREKKETILSDFNSTNISDDVPQDSVRTRSRKDRKLAKLLQKEEKKLRKEEEKNSKKQKRTEERDRKIAQRLQDSEDRAYQTPTPHGDEQSMMATNVGKAVLAVERIIQLVDSLKSMKNRFEMGLEPVAKDDMVYFAERLLEKQEEFRSKGISTEVDIGFHFTDETSMNDIQANGLMTKEDRIKNNIKVDSKGAVFGDGIYTANNPTHFSRFGKVGLIVARLQGKKVRVAKALPKKFRTQANTFIGDKSAKSTQNWPKSDKLNEIVLRTSSQCLPLVRFDRKNRLLLTNPDAYVLNVAASLKAVVNEIFNGHQAPNPDSKIVLSPFSFEPAPWSPLPIASAPNCVGASSQSIQRDNQGGPPNRKPYSHPGGRLQGSAKEIVHLTGKGYVHLNKVKF